MFTEHLTEEVVITFKWKIMNVDHCKPVVRGGNTKCVAIYQQRPMTDESIPIRNVLYYKSGVFCRADKTGRWKVHLNQYALLKEQPYDIVHSFPPFPRRAPHMY